ncbi:MAG: ZIP family metal transporter [Patescibacteria group bacterium]|nr:ZIP family metal transporter [Patescibacteria group bacterium]MDE1944281.1 ZIP family metal transporter [Patescibacteria group bacterium]MDE1945118.1 ZIP family metal transporter [Patescibacteria group bacterium]MDE2057638.1 ZIP family metal transporter [Patescibacteria group bacterium]
MVIFIALAAGLATLAGGALALTFRDHLHLILGFSAGAVAGVALFDLLPEAIGLGAKYHAASAVALFVALGFFGYLILDRLILLHTHDDEAHAEHAHPRRGALGAATLSAHSFLDGVAIGVGFQASALVGAIVAAAILTHDFSDGINTVNYILRNKGGRARAFRWLLADAVAPVLGAASTLLFAIPASAIGLVLAVFVGTFLYLSAADLIPESHHRHPRALTTLMTLLGAFIIWAVVSVA